MSTEKSSTDRVTEEILLKSIQTHFDTQDAKVVSYEINEGSVQGFASDISSVDVKVQVNGKMDMVHYMAKCLPFNETRNKFMNSVCKFYHSESGQIIFGDFVAFSRKF